MVGFALLLRFAENPLVESQVKQRMEIHNGSALYNQLQNPGLPLWKSFYFYNLTNYQEWADGKSLPKIEEKGPYSYKENRTKYIQSIEGDTLVYNQTKYFHWDQSASGENLTADDIICTINIPMVAAISEKEDANFFIREGLKAIFKAEKAHMYICHTATDLAWHYTDPLVKMLHKLGQYPRDYVNIQVNGSLNDSLHSAINTGASYIKKLGEFIAWDGHTTFLDTWPNGTATGANRIRGTEGLFFRPLLKEGDNLTAFIDDVQRSFDLQYMGKVKHLDTEAFRYQVVNTTFKSAQTVSENSKWGSWCPDGLIFLGPTQYPEIPVFGSKPHYLDGVPELRNCCIGMTEPNRTLHDITIDVEPTTGANIQVKQILQINVQVNKSKHFDQTGKLMGYNFDSGNTLYFPVLWLSEHAELTPKFQQYLDDQGLSEVELVRKGVPIIFWVLIGLAVVCAMISVASCVGYTVRARRRMARESNDGERRALLNPPRLN
uniref:CD36-like lysosomal integral membrane protein II n=1 Tax=Suberites domuncula TaxID=55567 RepID=Q70NV9_SUBDO|nr:CD36-like lysosomal integral membrane protein II [Suberites domuncula]